MNENKMDLEEAIKTLKIVANKLDQPFKFAIETVLQELENLKEEYRQYREFICVTGGKDVDDITATQYVIIQREGYLRGRKEEQEKAREYILELQKNSIPKKKIEDKIKELKQNQKLEKEGIFNRENVECIEENGKIKILQELLEDK